MGAYYSFDSIHAKMKDAIKLFDTVDPDELIWFHASSLIMWKNGAVDNMDAVASMMYKGGPMIIASSKPSTIPDNRPDPKYWDAVKKEMFLFICTQDKKYKRLWAEIEKVRKKGTTAVVGVVSAALGEAIGVPATIIVAFVAVCLYALLKIGKEAYCRMKATPAN